MKNTVIICFAAALFFSGVSNAQLQSVKFFGNYSYALKDYTTNSYIDGNKKVVSADAVGGGLEVKYHLLDRFHLAVQAGYGLYAIHQDSALERWEWRFWETRYKGNVRDALKSDTSLSATISTIQKMDTYPVFLVLNFEFFDSPQFAFDAEYGIGLIFFTRRLFLEETWRKKFPQVGYQVEYSFQNFAPSRVGNPVASFVGANATWKISELFGLTGSARYVHVYDTGSEFNYNDFPLRRALDVKLGLTIYY